MAFPGLDQGGDNGAGGFFGGGGAGVDRGEIDQVVCGVDAGRTGVGEVVEVGEDVGHGAGIDCLASGKECYEVEEKEYITPGLVNRYKNRSTGRSKIFQSLNNL